jgi:hypothetical protein
MTNLDRAILRAAALYGRLRRLDPRTRVVVLGYPEPRTLEVHLDDEAIGIRFPVEIRERLDLPFASPGRFERHLDPVALADCLVHLLGEALYEARARRDPTPWMPYTEREEIL